MRQRSDEDAWLDHAIGQAAMHIDAEDRAWLAEEGERIRRLERELEHATNAMWGMPTPSPASEPEAG